MAQRTTDLYHHKKIERRRTQIESQLNQSLPLIQDHILLELYKLACSKYRAKCNSNYDYNGFSKTYPEKVFLNTIETVIKNNPELKYLEIYPSSRFSKDLIPLNKMVVGNHVPDFLTFGLKSKGYSSIAFEIDGDSHENKYSKDKLYYDHMEEVGICCLSIPNDKVMDQDYILNTLRSLYKKRSGSLDKQIKRNKRLIWTKTISCHLSLEEIENIVLQRFSIQLNLLGEKYILLTRSDCPRKIKAEF